MDKPILKAGRAYHKYKAKRNCWPIVRGVAMNVSVQAVHAASLHLPFFLYLSCVGPWHGVYLVMDVSEASVLFTEDCLTSH